MSDAAVFLDELDRNIERTMTGLDVLKDPEPSLAGSDEVVRRLKMALKNELEAAELAALWMPTTPEVDIKLGLARQAGDEARHYHLIEEHMSELGVELDGFDPLEGGYGPMFQLLSGFSSTVERVAGAQLTRESLALKKNEQFIEFCDAVGAPETATLYRERIQPDEEWHVRLGRQALGRYAVTPELREAAKKASEAVLELAVKIQKKQLHEMKTSHAPGC
jgi:bacterioferritin (cytochrome b1)